MPKIKPTPSQVFTAENQTALIKVINSLWGMQIDTITQDRVIRALELQGLPNEWLDELTQNVDFFIDNQMTPTMIGKTDLAGSTLVDLIDETMDVGLAYTPGSNAISFVNNEMSVLLNDIKNPLNNNVAELLRNSIDNNWSITQTQELMSQAMTLTERESNAVIRFFNNMDPELTTSQRRALINNYYNKMLRVRSERIARTELTRVKHFGEMDALNQNIQLGIISKATKIWNRTNFKDNWESSIINDGVEVGIDEGFPEPCATGNDQYPSEINEYCYLDYNVI